jgi:hypothetical protein
MNHFFHKTVPCSARWTLAGPLRGFESAIRTEKSRLNFTHDNVKVTDESYDPSSKKTVEKKKNIQKVKGSTSLLTPYLLTH